MVKMSSSLATIEDWVPQLTVRNVSFAFPFEPWENGRHTRQAVQFENRAFCDISIVCLLTKSCFGCFLSIMILNDSYSRFFMKIYHFVTLDKCKKSQFFFWNFWTTIASYWQERSLPCSADVTEKLATIWMGLKNGHQEIFCGHFKNVHRCHFMIGIYSQGR